MARSFTRIPLMFFIQDVVRQDGIYKTSLCRPRHCLGLINSDMNSVSVTFPFDIHVYEKIRGYFHVMRYTELHRSLIEELFVEPNKCWLKLRISHL